MVNTAPEEQRFDVPANQARSQNTSGLQDRRKRDSEYDVLREEPSRNDVVRVREDHPTNCALNEAQQPNNPHLWN